MELEFTPGILDTPSLLTPNIGVTPLLYKSPQTDSVPTDNELTQTESTSNPSSIMTVVTTTNDESLSVSSAEIKLSKIENELKQSFSQSRKPTESPFQRIVEAGVLSYEKNSTILPPTMSDGIPANVPSTAEVMNDIESFSKAAASKEVNEREATVSDTSPSQAMGVIVSPKKKLLFRSQSHTDPASPTSAITNNLSQLQKSLRDEDNSTDEDHNHHFQRLQDLPILTHPVDSSAQIDNNHETTYTIQVRTNPNGAQQTISKQQATVLSNKRSFGSAILASPVTKANSILLSQSAVINEVSSSDQSLGSKRQKTSSTTSRISLTLPTTDDDDNNNNSAHSDDQRKKQIRDSNREAARRCRERRRNYIEQLEGNLEQYKTQIKQLTENLARAERENTQLRAIISEAKLFPSTVRITTNDAMMDFSSNGIDVASETTDGNAIQRDSNMKYLFLIYTLPILLASAYHEIHIKSDDDCWSLENNKTIEKNYAVLVNFAPKIAYGKDSCSVHIANPWLPNMQNGFGLFLSRQQMDCSSILTINCLPDGVLHNQAIPSSAEFTCHTSKNKVQMPCSTLELTFKRNLNKPGVKSSTLVQVVALAKEPCDDKDIFFQCPNDYPHSCLDKKLECNGRSECLSGDDERSCHPTHSEGVPTIVIILLVLLFLFLICILSAVLVCCCCRAACKGIVRRIRSKKGKKSATKGDVTISAEEAGLIKEITAPSNVVETLPQQHMEPAPLIIDSTKPIYPRLE
ncbi:unnamed protein product [Adineta ricciae]|uniref:BZIP domain-containing protein n=1 Tax=Adineta ricciae TaxID=249248 RepID=A0A813WZ99_ADIRI|nr:unnamed protein product [Adineta ricciae]